MISIKRITIILVLAILGENTIYGMTQSEIKHDSAAAADTKAVQADRLSGSGIPKPVQDLTISYLPFDWRWLPAFKMKQTILKDKKYIGGIHLQVKLDEERLAVSFRKDGRNVGTIKIWNLRTNEIVATLEAGAGINSLARLDGQRLALGLDDGTIQIWNLVTNKVSAILEHKNDATTRSKYHRPISFLVPLDENRLVSCAYDNTIKLWDLRTNELMAIIAHFKDERTYYVTLLTQLDENRIAAGFYDGTLRIWDLRDLKKTHVTLEGCGDPVRLLMPLDRHELAVVYRNDYGSHIKIWDPVTNESHHYKLGDIALCKLIKLDEYRLVSGQDDGTLIVWDLRNMDEPSAILKGHTAFITSLIQLDGNVVASGSYDGTIKIWDLAKPEKPIITLKEHDSVTLSLIKLERHSIVSSRIGNDDISIWEVDKEQLAKVYMGLKESDVEHELPLTADAIIPAVQQNSIPEVDDSMVTVALSPAQQDAISVDVRFINNLCTIL